MKTAKPKGDILSGLNPEQKRAVLQTEGPVLVLAGAGSGKTRVITRRIAHLLSKGVPPSAVLAVTFTNKAAREMRSRVAELVDAAAKELTVSTFHSFCLRLLRTHAAAAGLPPHFAICDESDQLTAVKNALRDLRIPEATVHPNAALSRISLFKNRLVTPEMARADAKDDWEDLVARAYGAYNAHLRRSRAVDFDDLLLCAGTLLTKDEAVLRKLQDRYRYLLVDEYQDTNGPQYEILRLLAGKRRNLCVVGDDDQCLAASTSIAMASGSHRSISRIKPGDLVLSAYGSGLFRPARVFRVHRKPYRGPGVEIRTRSGRRLVSTPEHMHFAGYRNGIVHDSRLLARVFSSFDTPAQARRLLADRGLSHDHPHHRPRSRDSNRRNVVVTLCGDRRGKSPMHRISIVGNDVEGRRRLQDLGFSVRPVRKGSRSWRFETCLRDLGRLYSLVDRIRKAFDFNLFETGRLGLQREGRHEGNSLPLLPAASVMPGMAMFTQTGGYDLVKSVRTLRLDQSMYDLDVESTHNYVANRVVTHNSIYGWRGADVRKILAFEKDFPGATVVRLETNYRSTQTILDAANAVIRQNKSRHEKTLRAHAGPGEAVRILPMHDEEHESQFVVDEIQREVRNGRAKFGDYAVLFRTAVQPRTFEARLRAARIPYDLVGGMSFFDRKEVRDVLAYLRLANNPHDEASLLRVINVPPRGVGKGTLDRVIEAATKEGVSAAAVLDRPGSIGLPPEPLAVIGSFRRVLSDFAAKIPAAGLTQSIRELLLSVRYPAELDRCYPDALTRQARWAAVEEVVNIAENYARRTPKPSLEGFLEEVTLSAEDSREEPEEGKPRDVVTLMTLHAAKGLEFPRVYLVGVEEGLLPHLRSMMEDTVEEERRLMYVGITRAKRHLTITRAASRAKYGQRAPCLPSRFIYEIRGETPPFSTARPPSKEEAPRKPAKKPARRK